MESLSSKTNPAGAREKVEVIHELRHQFNFRRLLDFAQIPRSTFFHVLKQMRRPDKYEDAKKVIEKIFDENKGRYGYRRITLALKSQGVPLNHKTVSKLMKQIGLKCEVRMKKYRSYREEVGKVAPNLLNRNFKASQPNRKWVTDVTEFSLFGSKLYLSPILDLYNGEIISYTLSDRPTFNQVSEMLDIALDRLNGPINLILHSDQGWQYQMKPFQYMLERNGIRQSMSRKGNCLDNAVMENFFGHLKSELLYLRKFGSMDEFKSELTEYIDYYNNKRIKSKLKGLSPVQYRTQSQSSA